MGMRRVRARAKITTERADERSASRLSKLREGEEAARAESREPHSAGAGRRWGPHVASACPRSGIRPVDQRCGRWACRQRAVTVYAAASTQRDKLHPFRAGTDERVRSATMEDSAEYGCAVYWSREEQSRAGSSAVGGSR